MTEHWLEMTTDRALSSIGEISTRTHIKLVVVILGTLQFSPFTGANTEAYTSCSIEDCAIQQLPPKNQVSEMLI